MAKAGIQPILRSPDEKFMKSETPDGQKIDLIAGVDTQIAGLVDQLSQDVDIPDDPDYQPVRFAGDGDGLPTSLPPQVAAQAQSLNDQLKVSALPTDVLSTIQAMQNNFMTTISALQSQIDSLSGRKQSAAARRAPIIEDCLSDRIEQYVVTVTGRYKYGNERFDLLTPGAIVDLPKHFGDRLRKSQCVKRVDEMYDM